MSMLSLRSGLFLISTLLLFSLGSMRTVAAPFVYSLSYSGDIKVFDVQTQSFVVNSIAAPSAAAAFALSPTGDRLYVNSGGTAVNVIDTATNLQVATIAVSCLPDDGTRIAVRQQNDRFYLVCKTAAAAFSVFPVSIIGNTYSVQPAITGSPFAGRSVAVAINTAGDKLWVARETLNVLPIDLLTGSAGAPIAGTVDPNALTDLAYDAALNRVYVPTASGAAAIDGNSNAVLATFGSTNTAAVATSPDGSRVYALTTAGGGTITAYTSAGALIGTVTGLAAISGAQYRFAIAVSPTDGKVIVLVGGQCGAGAAATGYFQLIDPVTLVAAAPIVVPGVYCEPRAPGQIIVRAAGPVSPGIVTVPQSVPTLSLLGNMILMLSLMGLTVSYMRRSTIFSQSER